MEGCPLTERRVWEWPISWAASFKIAPKSAAQSLRGLRDAINSARRATFLSWFKKKKNHVSGFYPQHRPSTLLPCMPVSRCPVTTQARTPACGEIRCFLVGRGSLQGLGGGKGREHDLQAGRESAGWHLRRTCGRADLRRAASGSGRSGEGHRHAVLLSFTVCKHSHMIEWA